MSFPEATAPARVYTVSELNAVVHELLEASFSQLWVEGEISNCRAYPSGHIYFTLKDAGSQISAVLFRGNALGLKFKLQDGLKVLARGRVSSYVKRGDLQLIVAALEPRDIGAQQLALKQLKERLAAEGLFDPARKRPLPPYPRSIGIVTSLQGAAVHDILTVLRRRWEGLRVLIRPVSVQGDGAAVDIAQAVADFNAQSPETEVLLVGRGGGSAEDLWCFNDEKLARAIAASRIPVISCVGHETDLTVADLVADVRAPTPSAAAELAVPDKQALLRRIDDFSSDIIRLACQRIKRLEERLAALARHPFLKSPWRLYEERLLRVGELACRLPEAVLRRLADAEKDLAISAARLDALSPLKVLGRGYAIVQKLPGLAIVRSARQAKPGDRLKLKLHEGGLNCEVLSNETGE